MAGVEVVEVEAPAARLASAMGPEGSLAVPRLARGCRAFVAGAGGAVAGYGWLSEGPEWIGEVGLTIAPAPGEAYVWNCVTLPEWRRRGVFRLLLQAIVARSGAEGRRRLWIGSVGEPGAAAVAWAGFAPVLEVTCRPAGGLCLITTRPAPAAEAGAPAAARSALGLGRGPSLRRRRRRLH